MMKIARFKTSRISTTFRIHWIRLRQCLTADSDTMTSYSSQINQTISSTYARGLRSKYSVNPSIFQYHCQGIMKARTSAISSIILYLRPYFTTLGFRIEPQTAILRLIRLICRRLTEVVFWIALGSRFSCKAAATASDFCGDKALGIATKSALNTRWIVLLWQERHANVDSA